MLSANLQSQSQKNLRVKFNVAELWNKCLLLTTGRQEFTVRPDKEIEIRRGKIGLINIYLEIETIQKDKRITKYLCIDDKKDYFRLNNEEISKDISLSLDNVLVKKVLETYKKLAKRIKSIKLLEKCLIKEVETLEIEMKGS